MLKNKLKYHTIILASKSPRRQALLKNLNLDFEVRLHPIEEIYPEHLTHYRITNYLAKLKAQPLKTELKPKDILITSDTIVWHNNNALGKPKHKKEAVSILKSLSNTTHNVITSVCFTTTSTQKIVYDVTKVSFKSLTTQEIEYYVTNYKPFDKAGAYGIQDWIGQIAVTSIEGSYFNVMGFPVHLVYKTLNGMVSL